MSEVEDNLRITTSLQNKIIRRQFLRPQARSSANQIPLNASQTVAAVLPYAGNMGFTPTASFYRHISHPVVCVDSAAWRLNIHGLVSNPLSVSLDDIENMQIVEMPCTLAAITSTPNNLLVGYALWKGIPLKGLLEYVGLREEAQYAQFTSANGYTTYLPLKILGKALLAYAMNGKTLPVDQGYPIRLIVPGVYDYKMPKWLQSIELVVAPSSGHYESRGWSANGAVQTTSAIFTPRPREIMNGKILFSGMAFAGTRAITQIELSIDDGEWMPVPFVPAGSGSWTPWQIDWLPPASADYLVKVRATDSEDFTQIDKLNLPVFPNGSSVTQSVIFRATM